jgi:hypothetical protein
MIPGQPIPTELDLAAQRAADRRQQAAMPPAVAPAEALSPGPSVPMAPATAELEAAGAISPPPTSAPAPPASPAPAGPPPADPSIVGVVFIHGIGAQRAGETVLAWSQPIIRVLTAWAEDRGLSTDPVVRSRVDLTGRTTPFIELEVAQDPDAPTDRPAQRWVLTEAWWASDVEAPGISSMIRWLIWRGEARRIGDGILTGINAADDLRADTDPAASAGTGHSLRRRLRDGAERLLILGFFLVLALVAVPLYALIKLLSALPIPTIVQGVSTAQLDWFLADWFGDVRVLLGDRAQAANIRSRVETTIEALREYGCGRIVVVGHSGGTIVSYMALADLSEDLHVDGLVTHGQALGLAWRLGHFTGPLATFVPEAGDEDELLRRGDRLVRPLPDGLRWDDFWATHDPAPAGPLDDPVRCVTLPTASHVVVNRHSLANDHGGYWDNDEGFVIPVMRTIDTAGRPGAESRFFPGYTETDVRIVARAERVALLSRFWLAWLVLAGSTIVVAVLAGSAGFPSFGAFLLGLPGSIAEPPAPGEGLWVWLVGAIGVAILTFGVQRVAIARWDEWDLQARARARHRLFVAPRAGSLLTQWVILLVAQVLVLIAVISPELRVPVLIGYGVALLFGWFPREWRRRLEAPPVAPPDD